MTELKDGVVAITGAAGGIGRALALEVADRGGEVAISDVEESNLEQTAEQVRQRGARCSTNVVDVAERDEVHDWAEEVSETHGAVNVIINNAGVSLSASVEAMDYEDFEWLMEINFWGVVHGTKAFLPLIREAGRGRVVNMSSAFGLVASPTQSAYNASKFAVRGFTESLRSELELMESDIGATCIHPGGIQTDIVRNGRFADTGDLNWDRESTVEEFDEMIARTSPEDAATRIANGIEGDEGRVRVGMDCVAIDVFQRLAPEKYTNWLAAWLAWQRQ